MRNGLEPVQSAIGKQQEATPQSLDTTTVQQAIEKALHHVEQVDARRVNIAIEDNCVFLRGDVKTWPEHQAAASAVAAIDGVRKVENQLRVAPGCSE